MKSDRDIAIWPVLGISGSCVAFGEIALDEPTRELLDRSRLTNSGTAFPRTL